MEQPSEFSGQGINARDIWAFEAVAMKARQSQVVFVGSPVVLRRDDVVNLKSKPLQRWQAAVFTVSSSPKPNKLFQFAIHYSPHTEALLRNNRALDFINSIRQPTCR